MSGRHTTLAAVLLAAGGPALAADYTPPPAVAAGTVVGVHADAAGGCATCAPDAGTRKPGQALISRLRPTTVQLAPGACFGYFPTQWRKWDEVCPYPYSPAGLSEGQRPPVPYPGYGDRPEPKGPNGELPTPRPVDPKSDTPVKPDPNGAARALPPANPRVLPPPPANPRVLPPPPLPLNHTIPPVPVNTRPLPPPPPLPGEKAASR
ncbi:MAG: hypothetical protein C0501_04810 [Isosphaera sp.]|nr:hypothetical protein [Isosphaera sp.]